MTETVGGRMWIERIPHVPPVQVETVLDVRIGWHGHGIGPKPRPDCFEGRRVHQIPVIPIAGDLRRFFALPKKCNLVALPVW